MMTQPETRRIVVGVDGSPDSLHALRWAGRLSAALDAPLQAMFVWEPPFEFGWTHPQTLNTLDWHAQSLNRLKAAVDEAFGPDAPDGISMRVVQGYPAAKLVEASRDALLLVVGSRGHGGFSSVVLGSVSVKCAEHAHCPVLVARSDSRVTEAAHEAGVSGERASTDAVSS
jgi:nucleotide-binding universal stress UspA family protein